MQRFFVRPASMTAGLRFTLLAGFLFAVLHFVAFFNTDQFAAWAVAIAACGYIFGLSIFWWAIAANRRQPLAACFAEGEQLHLTEHGPYRFVRHPFYCSYLLTWLAGAIGTLNVGLGLTFLTMLVLYLTAARAEENKFASSPLAETYATYRARTGQFFPNPFKLLTVRRSS